MTEHDRIQELLAGYALRSLSGEDAAETDRLLDEHVPDCEECRGTVEAYGAVAGELALAAEPLEPPDLLLARLHHDLEPSRGRLGRVGTGWLVAAAAAFVGLVALGGVFLGGGGTSATLAAANLQQVGRIAERPDAETNSIGAVDEVTVPDRSGFYLWGRDVPTPPEGMIYRLWLLEDGEAYYVGDFVPDVQGDVAIHVEVEGGYDEVVVSTEPLSSPPADPSGTVWSVAPAGPDA